METKYGYFSKEQMNSQKQYLHSSIHWLLRYKEQDYPYLEEYFSSLLFKLSGLNSLLDYPPEFVSLLSLIEGARLETHKANFNFHDYRKAILDAHSLIDNLDW